MTKYAVYTPEIELYPASEDHMEPAEYGCCYVELEARNKREAMRLALKTSDFEKWVQQARDNLENPFARVKAERVVWDEEAEGYVSAKEVATCQK